MLEALIPYLRPPEKLIADLPVIGPLKLQFFGPLVAAGVILGYHRCLHYAKRKNIDEFIARDMMFWVLVTGFVISHWVSVLFYFPEDVAANPLVLIMVWNGLSSVGGFFGALVGMVWYLHKMKQPYLVYVDMLMYGLLVGFTMGRLGCSLVHDHPGSIVDASHILAVGPWPDGQYRLDLGLLAGVGAWRRAVHRDRLAGQRRGPPAIAALRPQRPRKRHPRPVRRRAVDHRDVGPGPLQRRLGRLGRVAHLHLVAAAAQARLQRRRQRAVVLDQQHLGAPRQQLQQALHRQRLGQHRPHHSQVRRRRQHLVRGVRGHQQEGRGRVLQRQAADQLDPVHPRHPDVRQHEVEVVLLSGAQRRLGGEGRAHDAALVAQDLGQVLRQQPIVVDDQDPPRHECTPPSTIGTRTSKAAPPPA